MAKRIHYKLLVSFGGILCFGIISLVFIGAKPAASPLSPLLTKNTQFSLDLNNDGINETGEIQNNTAFIYSNQKKIFETPKEWKIHEILAGDFNNDGTNDFALTLWKHGNYGPSTPFWITENKNTYKMHLFLYTWKRNKIAPLWHSSDLPRINLRTKLITHNQKNYLLVLEKKYTDKKSFNNFSIGIWQWNQWGFELQKRFPLFK